jgi:hypothetical protein
MSFLFGILIIIGILGLIIAIAGLAGLICYEEGWIMLIIGLFLLIGSIVIDVKIADTDQYRALDCSNIITEYARVNDISEKSITLDNEKYGSDSSSLVVEKKYPIHLEDYKVGDIVKYQYISTDFSDYLIRIEIIK